MAEGTVSQLLASASALMPDAVGPSLQQFVTQRIANAITVEYTLNTPQKSFLSEYYGPGLLFPATKYSNSPLKSATRLLAQKDVYQAAGIEPADSNSTRRYLIVGPHEGEISRFGARNDIDFLPFFYSFTPESMLTSLSKAFARKRKLPAANYREWRSYQMMGDEIYKPEFERPYAIVNNYDFFKAWCEAVGQDLLWKSKHYDAVVVTEHAAAYLSREAWSNLERITGASAIYWYSPFVEEIKFGCVVPSEVYSYKEYNRDTGSNVFAAAYNVNDMGAEYPLHHREEDAKGDVPHALESLFTGHRRDMIGVISWTGLTGTSPGEQFCAPLETWGLLSCHVPIRMVYDATHVSMGSHMLPRLVANYGTYVVGVWQVTRQPYTVVLHSVLPRSRYTVRVPRVSLLVSSWHNYRLKFDEDEHAVRKCYQLLDRTVEHNVYIHAEMFESALVYVQRVAAKVRDDPNFISSVVGYLVKMLGAQTLVGSVALNMRTYHVPQRALLDIAYCVIRDAQQVMLQLRKVQNTNTLWDKLKAHICTKITDTWVGDFLDWLYGNKPLVEYLPTEIATYDAGGNLGFRFKIEKVDVKPIPDPVPYPPRGKYVYSSNLKIGEDCTIANCLNTGSLCSVVAPKRALNNFRVFRGTHAEYVRVAYQALSRYDSKRLLSNYDPQGVLYEERISCRRCKGECNCFDGKEFPSYYDRVLNGLVKYDEVDGTLNGYHEVHKPVVFAEYPVADHWDGRVADMRAALESDWQIKVAQSVAVEETVACEEGAEDVHEAIVDLAIQPAAEVGGIKKRRFYEIKYVTPRSVMPQIKVDLDDPDYKPKQDFKNIAEWEQEAAKRPVNGWHWRKLSTYVGDDTWLTIMKQCVEQVVLTKHLEYQPTPFEFSIDRGTIQAYAQDLNTKTFKTTFPESKEGLNPLQRTIWEYLAVLRDTFNRTVTVKVPEVVIFEGGPGCGKSYTARRIMQYKTLTAWLNRRFGRTAENATFAVLGPLAALATDYGSIYMYDECGKDLPCLIDFKTPHKSVKFNSATYLFVDEFTLVDSMAFLVALYKTRPSYVILMGDTAQNHLRPEYGVSLFSRWPKLKQCNTYRFVMNHRNPANHVEMLSAAYLQPQGAFMLPGRKGTVGKVYVSDSPKKEWQHPDEPCSSPLPTHSADDRLPIKWCTFTLSDKKVLCMLAPELQVDDIDTVTALQGKTYDHLGIVMTSSAYKLLGMPSQPYVGFSRHKGNLYIVNPRADMSLVTSNIATSLDPKINAQVIHDTVMMNVAGYPTPDVEEEEQVLPPPEAAIVVPDKPSNDAYTYAQELVDPHCASVSEMYAALPLNPDDVGKKFPKPYTLQPPYNAGFRKGGALAEDFKPGRQVGDETIASLSQTDGAHQIARTAVSRFGRVVPVTYTAAGALLCKKMVSTYFKDCKDDELIAQCRNDNALFMRVVKNWLTDVKKRKYFERLFGADQAPNDLLLGFVPGDGGVLAIVDKLSAHLAQKAQNKPVNQQKGFDINKVGQPLVPLDLKVVLEYAILCRWLTVLDMSTSKTKGDYVCVEHNGRDTTRVKGDIDEWLQVNDDGTLEIASCDIAEADVAANQFSQDIVVDYCTRLAGEEYGPILVKMFSAFGSNLMLRGARISIAQYYENLSGSPWTLLYVTIFQKVVNHYVVPTKWGNMVALRRLMSNIGDDAIIIQSGMKHPTFKAKHARRAMKVELMLGFRFKIVVIGRDEVVEFVGHSVGITEDGKFRFVPSLGRRLKRFLTHLYPIDDADAKEYFEEAQKSIRDYFETYAAMKSDIVVANAQLVYNDLPEGLPDAEARQIAMARSLWHWDVFYSFGHLSWEQFKPLLNPTESWKNVRIVVLSGGVAALI